MFLRLGRSLKDEMGFTKRYEKVLDRCMSLNHFGEEVAYTAAGASQPVTILGVPSNELLEVFSQSTSSITKKPRLVVSQFRTDEIGLEPKKDDTLVMRTVTFKVDKVEPDGEGAIALLLKRVT